MVLAAERDLGGEARPAPGNADYAERSPEGPDPIGKTSKARSVSRVRTPDAVVFDHNQDARLV